MRLPLFCLICLFPLQALSEDLKSEKKSPESGLTGQLSLSVSSSAGNTNLGSFNVGVTAKYQNQTPWIHIFRGSIRQSEAAKNRNAKRKVNKDIKRFGYIVDYDLLGNKDLLVGAYIGYEEDKKVKLKSEIISMLGIERQNIGTEKHQFKVGASVGYMKVQYTDNTDAISTAAARASIDYKGKITDKISFHENMVVLYSKERTMKRATSSLNYAITDKASIALSHEISLRTKIADTATDKKDDIASLNFILKF
jgi:putative salt-induced outer membrane protein YdiY